MPSPTWASQWDFPFKNLSAVRDSCVWPTVQSQSKYPKALCSATYALHQHCSVYNIAPELCTTN